MSETPSGIRPRIVKFLQYGAVCLSLCLIWKGWGYVMSTSEAAYKQARTQNIFRNALDIFPRASTQEVRLVRFRHFNKSFMWANHILVARFEGVDTRFVDDLRKRYCTEAAAGYDLEMRERQSTKKWNEFTGAVQVIRDGFVDRRKDFEYCPVSYIPLPGQNHTETVIWLEKGGRTAILYGEFFSG